MPENHIYSHIRIKLRKYPVYDSDVFVVSYPRSGNTWLRYLLTGLVCADREIDYDLVAKTVIDFYVNKEHLETAAPVRYIKSHEPYTKRYPKVLYIYRDGRDVCGSYYRFYKQFYGYTKNFDEFLKSMLNGNVRFGAWQDHIDSWLSRDHDIPFLAVQYEKMLTGSSETIREISAFLGLDLTDSVIQKALDSSSIGFQMKEFLKNTSGKTIEPPDIKNKQLKWISEFSPESQDYFFEKAGHVMSKLGYKKYEFPGLS